MLIIITIFTLDDIISFNIEKQRCVLMFISSRDIWIMFMLKSLEERPRARHAHMFYMRKSYLFVWETCFMPPSLFSPCCVWVCRRDMRDAARVSLTVYLYHPENSLRLSQSVQSSILFTYTWIGVVVFPKLVSWFSMGWILNSLACCLVIVSLPIIRRLFNQ